MTITCEIVLDENVVYSGQILSGTVHLSTKDEKTVRGITIHIKGLSSVVVRYGNTTYILKQEILDTEVYVVGSSDGKIRLTPGFHNFKFQFMLPPECPSTLSIYPLAITCYEVRVVVDVPFWINKKFIKPFTVIKPLCVDETLLLPFAVEVSETFAYNCLLFWKTSDPLEIVARIPVRGYYPGETINLELDVKNRSHATVTKFTVKLKKRITCFYKKKMTDHNHEDSCISRIETRGCKSNQDAKIQVNVEVPLTLPTNKTKSSIIQIKYSIEITGHVDGFCHLNPSLKMPIEVGRLPRNVDASTLSELIKLDSLLESDG